MAGSLDSVQPEPLLCRERKPKPPQGQSLAQGRGGVLKSLPSKASQLKEPATSHPPIPRTRSSTHFCPGNCPCPWVSSVWAGNIWAETLGFVPEALEAAGSGLHLKKILAQWLVQCI